MMAKRYRPFKRINLTAKTAKLIYENLVGLTFREHYGMVCAACSWAVSETEEVCRNKGCGATERVRKHRSCETDECLHTESGTLVIAKMLESGMKIGKKRATLDLPDDKDRLLLFVARLRLFAKEWPKQVKAAAMRIADDAENYAERSPLHRLAECALDVDWPEDA